MIDQGTDGGAAAVMSGTNQMIFISMNHWMKMVIICMTVSLTNLITNKALTDHT